MEESKNFIKGMHSDFSEQNQPQSTYRSAKNIVRNLDGSIESEYGTTTFCDNFPNKQIIGSLSIGDIIVFFLKDLNGEDEIGYINKNNVYNRVVASLELNFNENYLILSRGRVDYRGHRLVYFVDGLNPARKIDIDSPPTTDISENLELQLTNKLPIVDVVSITEDGNLPTGVYQFSVRLLTASLNRSSTSLMTNVVPLVNESIAGDSRDYDGAIPQTSSFKAINLSISNIDTKFKFIEIVATTYNGTSNTLVSNVVGLEQIKGSTMEFKYHSLSQRKEEVIIEDLVADTISYDCASTIEQKDGRLILGNLKATRFNPDFQAVANKIIAKYTIKEMEFTENINVKRSFNRNNSVDCLDIGGSNTSFADYKDGLNTTKYKGYQRDEVYSFAIVPIFKNGSYGYAYHIPGSFNPFTNESQGPIGPTSADVSSRRLGFFKCRDEAYPAGYNYPEGNITYHKMPSLSQEPLVTTLGGGRYKLRALGLVFENINFTSLSDKDKKDIVGYIIVRELRTESNKSILAQGIVNTTIGADNGAKFVTPWSGKNDYDYDLNRTTNNKHVAFYSPETTILKNDLSSATSIKSVALLQGNVNMVADERSDGQGGRFAHMFMNYTNVYNDSLYPAVQLDRNATQYIHPDAEGKNYELGGAYGSISTKGNNGFLYLVGQSDVPVYLNQYTRDKINNGTKHIGEITIDNLTYAETSSIRFHKGGFTYVQNQDEALDSGETRRNLFNVYSDKPNQYGKVLDKEYVIAGYRILESMNNSSLECWSGDIFINKTAIVTTTDISYSTDVHSFKTINYFFCESSINTTYRHHLIENGVAKTVDYYPHSRKFWTDAGDGLLQILTEYGHANGYNRQYSFDNILKKFFSKSITTEEEVESFNSRIIYSEISIEGEQFDAYRLFLPNNYHDVPKHRGVISDMFVQSNTLYIHTPQTLYKTFFNDATAAITTSGEVSLGNGGLFPRPSIEMTTVSGGYAGTNSPCGVNTPFGRIFVDEIQKKIFLYSDKIQEISLDGQASNFRAHLDIQKNTLDTGYTAAYDYVKRRYILCKRNGLAISYCPELKSWSSEHSYRPTFISTQADRLFLFKGSLLQEFLPGCPRANYFDTQYYSDLEVVFNDNPLVTKVADNLFTQSNSCFDHMSASNSNQYSPLKDIVLVDTYDYDMDLPIVARYNSNQYQMNVPRDEHGSRMKDKYIKITLLIDNSKHSSFLVNYLTLMYRPIAR
jgi:hypothetical protein